MPLAAEIDITNREQVCDQLSVALIGGAPVVIADFTRTTFCDSGTLRSLLAIHRQQRRVPRRGPAVQPGPPDHADHRPGRAAPPLPRRRPRRRSILGTLAPLPVLVTGDPSGSLPARRDDTLDVPPHRRPS